MVSGWAQLKDPNSIRIIKENGRYTVSFCYEDGCKRDQEHLNYLRKCSVKELKSMAIGIDRGVKRPVQAEAKCFDFTLEQKKKKDETGKWEKNGRKAKAGLNRSILDKGRHLLECFLKYKANRDSKPLFKIAANYTFQECSDCGYCENADKNGSKVIKKRAINLILYSGTELSKRGVLLDKGSGAINKTRGENSNLARGLEASKKKAERLSA